MLPNEIQIAPRNRPARGIGSAVFDDPSLADRLVAYLQEMASGDEAAYKLTSFADALLANVLHRDDRLTAAEARLVLGAIAIASVVVPERIDIDPVTTAEGMNAAAGLVRRRWIDDDSFGRHVRGKWELQARLKILRNFAHSVALRREIDEHAAFQNAHLAVS